MTGQSASLPTNGRRMSTQVTIIEPASQPREVSRIFFCFLLEPLRLINASIHQKPIIKEWLNTIGLRCCFWNIHFSSLVERGMVQPTNQQAVQTQKQTENNAPASPLSGAIEFQEQQHQQRPYRIHLVHQQQCN